MPPDIRVGGEGALAAPRDREGGLADGNPACDAARHLARAVILHDLHVDAGERRGGEEDAVERLVRDLRRTLAQSIVDRGTELVADEDVDGRGRKNDRERDRGGGSKREADAKAHGSRSAYPTPRTVWISRGLPPASVLRRRYPMYTSSEFDAKPKS